MDISEIYETFDVQKIVELIDTYYFDQNNMREYDISKKECKWLIRQLESIYHEFGFGFKSIARCLGLSYSQVRTMFKRFNIQYRTGNSVVTIRVKEHRKNRGTIEKNFFSNGIPKQCHTSRGVQGYYYSKRLRKYFWLRSSYEYIYAKWLDKNNIDYDVETRCYIVNGNKYTPDFFIYVNNNLDSIVEIKGYWKDKIWKIKSLSGDIDINVTLIECVDPYVECGSNKQKELRKWKKERLLKLPEQPRG